MPAALGRVMRAGANLAYGPTTTSAPARANATEIVRPIPRARAHPVTSTILPSNSLTGRTSLLEPSRDSSLFAMALYYPLMGEAILIVCQYVPEEP